MSSDGCDQQMSVQTFMFHIHTGDGIVKFYTNQESLSSDFFYMRKRL